MGSMRLSLSLSLNRGGGGGFFAGGFFTGGVMGSVVRLAGGPLKLGGSEEAVGGDEEAAVGWDFEGGAVKAGAAAVMRKGGWPGARGMLLPAAMAATEPRTRLRRDER